MARERIHEAMMMGESSSISRPSGTARPVSAAQRGRARVWVGVAAFVFALASWLSWESHQRLNGLLDRVDVRTLDASAKVLDQMVAQQSKRLASTAGVLAEDARIRAMVLTPTFDQATVVDLLTDLKATSGATVLAILDGAGKVRAVVGAPEMDQLDLGTSSLVRGAIEKSSAQLWAFANEVGVLSATPVLLDGQVRALFMMGFELDDAVFEDIQRALGTTGAIFVGDELVASATKDPEVTRALRSAAELQPGTYRVVTGGFLAGSSLLSDSAVSAKVAWLVPLYRNATEMTLTRALSWAPAALVGLVLVLMIGLALSQSRPQSSLRESIARRTTL
jgi:hypothetical protein